MRKEKKGKERGVYKRRNRKQGDKEFFMRSVSVFNLNHMWFDQRVQIEPLQGKSLCTNTKAKSSDCILTRFYQRKRKRKKEHE